MTGNEAQAKALELLQIIAIWGMNKADCYAISSRMAKTVLKMDEAEFEALRGGMHLKPLDAPANDRDPS